MILTREQLHDALVERHGAEIQKKLDGATVGIAGLGGLGSNLAVFLARLGVGHMILVDFDVVDITNLNRQHYTMKDLGVPKTLALVEQLEAKLAAGEIPDEEVKTVETVEASTRRPRF